MRERYYFAVAHHVYVRNVSLMRSTASVFRFEAEGEAGIPFPSLAVAVHLAPRHTEARIATSEEGVVLAEAEPVCGPGSILQWALTNAGQDVLDAEAWACPMSARMVDTVLAVALGDELAVAS